MLNIDEIQKCPRGVVKGWSYTDLEPFPKENGEIDSGNDSPKNVVCF